MLIIKNPLLGINFFSLHPKDYFLKKSGDGENMNILKYYFCMAILPTKFDFFHAKTDILKVTESNLDKRFS